MQHFTRIRRNVRILLAASIVGAWPLSLQALEFQLPTSASQSFDRKDAFSSYALPVGPFSDGAMKTQQLEGSIAQTAWSLPASALSTLQILVPLRDQLLKAGFTILFECSTNACGGFDFRFGADIAPEPAMHIDLGDFRYLAAKRLGPDGPNHVGLFVSRSSTLGFVQITQIGPAQSKPEALVKPSTKAPALPDIAENITPLAEGLANDGSVALDDLIFASSAADLSAGEYASLDALASYLRANPDNRVALVGHTDASGGLAGNISLSRDRAESVRARMINAYQLPPDQIIAEGVGYLAPRDGNLTDQGRTRNRRVEVMLLINP